MRNPSACAPFVDEYVTPDGQHYILGEGRLINLPQLKAIRFL